MLKTFAAAAIALLSTSAAWAMDTLQLCSGNSGLLIYSNACDVVLGHRAAGPDELVLQSTSTQPVPTVCNTLECGNDEHLSKKFAQTVFGESQLAQNSGSKEPAIMMTDGTGAAPHGGMIDIGQAFGNALAPYINAIANGLILLLVAWISQILYKRTGFQLDQYHQNSLARALQNQAGSLIADGAVALKGKTIDVHNEKLADAVNDLLNSVPDAAKHFGLTPDYVSKRIVDQIAQMSGQLAHEAVAAPEPVRPNGMA